ncbi:MAG: hypothetical protein OXC92_09160 [Flavobacteriaceae bacterium]|nr:hypothetical protein [Flavobacteriaceae bacterium]
MSVQKISSIYHFFAHLMCKRGYLIQDNNLEDFPYPEEIIAAKSKSGFPDMVLKINEDSELSGGELIEMKSSKSFQIASFNSTIPTAKKRFEELPKNIQDRLIHSSQNKKELEYRDVYYLIRGIKQTPSYPLSKTILVGGSFFETISVDDLLTKSFNQVAIDSMIDPSALNKISSVFKVKQSKFAKTRQIENSSVKIRFRVMTEVDPNANLLNSKIYSMIGDNTLTFLHHESIDSKQKNFYDWHSVSVEIKNCIGYRNLNKAYNDIDKDLKLDTKVSILHHPLNGPFFIAQASIQPK